MAHIERHVLFDDAGINGLPTWWLFKSFDAARTFQAKFAHTAVLSTRTFDTEDNWGIETAQTIYHDVWPPMGQIKIQTTEKIYPKCVDTVIPLR